MEVESKPVNESGDKKEEMTSADYYFDRYVQVSIISFLDFFQYFQFFLKIRFSKILWKKIWFFLVIKLAKNLNKVPFRIKKPKVLEEG